MAELNDEIMTTKEIAEYFKVSPNLIRAEVKKGRLPSFRIGQEIRFRKSEVEKTVFAK